MVASPDENLTGAFASWDKLHGHRWSTQASQQPNHWSVTTMISLAQLFQRIPDNAKGASPKTLLAKALKMMVCVA